MNSQSIKLEAPPRLHPVDGDLLSSELSSDEDTNEDIDEYSDDEFTARPAEDLLEDDDDDSDISDISDISDDHDRSVHKSSGIATTLEDVLISNEETGSTSAARDRKAFREGLELYDLEQLLSNKVAAVRQLLDMIYRPFPRGKSSSSFSTYASWTFSTPQSRTASIEIRIYITPRLTQRMLLLFLACHSSLSSFKLDQCTHMLVHGAPMLCLAWDRETLWW
ncbi:Hypothetical protein D9617_11g009370 [Elsinoe fawcettii]|nr:Hypothetical protein D9617_11g009370 [Elsinoe fawcettii]